MFNNSSVELIQSLLPTHMSMEKSGEVFVIHKTFLELDIKTVLQNSPKNF